MRQDSYTPEAADLIAAPGTQTRRAFDRDAVVVRVTARALMLRAESKRLGLRFKVDILSLFWQFVGVDRLLCRGCHN